MNYEKKVVIVVGVEPSRRGIETINLVGYELRVICVIKANSKQAKTSQFDAMRYMCHGNGDYSWWKQERSDPITTQLIYVKDIYDGMYHPNEYFYFIQYLYVYARIEHERYDQWRTIVLRVWV